MRILVVVVFGFAFFALYKSALRLDEIPMDCRRSALSLFHKAWADKTGGIQLFSQQEKVFADLDFYPQTVVRGTADRQMIISILAARYMTSFIEGCAER